MTDGDGTPVRRANGEFYTHRLKPDDNARAIAGRLTREIRSEGESDRAGFYRVLDYPKWGLV